jgi:hypothetical protein
VFAFAVLTAVFSHPVIRELGVVVVDADRSDTSRMFVELAASPNLGIVERPGDLASAASAIRSGEAKQSFDRGQAAATKISRSTFSGKIIPLKVAQISWTPTEFQPQRPFASELCRREYAAPA